MRSCSGTAAELEPHSASASLRFIDPLSSGGNSRCQPVPGAEGLSGHTLGVLASVFPVSQSDVEPPCVSRQAVYSALYHRLTNPPHSLWVDYTMALIKNYFNPASMVYIYL